MWKYLMACLLVGMTACNGTKEGSEKPSENTATIQGQWLIENVVENDSSYVRPSEIEQGITAYIDFRDDNTFGVMTNCNHLGGQYHQVADSICLTDLSATEMACDNMDLEEMLKKILPIVNTVDCINDSITRLNSDKGDSYIVLKKSPLPVK